MKKKIKILNGPPGAGKDTLANTLVDTHHHVRFKDKSYDLTISAWNLRDHREWFMYMVNHRELKEMPHSILTINDDCILDIENKLDIPLLKTVNNQYCTSPRGALIVTSELDIKPHFGKDYFGIVAGRNIKEISDKNRGVSTKDFMFSDGGFPDELTGLIDVLGTNDYEYYICRLHREGFNFSKDSRDYIQEEDVPDCFNFRDICLEDGDIPGAVNQLDF